MADALLRDIQLSDTPGVKWAILQRWVALLASNIGSGGTGLPSQVGNSGKFLTTDGTTASWSIVPAGDVTAAGNNAFTGLNSYTGAITGTYTAMPALAVNVAKWGNSYSATGDVTFTYSATPNAGTVTRLRITSDGTQRTITIPTTWSLTRNGNITQLVVPANTVMQVILQYNSGRWEIIGDPVAVSGTGSFVLDTAATLVSPTISTGLLAVGAAANDFSGSTGAFKTSTGANTLGGAVTVNDATTPSITTAAGKTNSGYLLLQGKTSGGLKMIAADAAAQILTVSLAAQTSGASTQTIPDMAGVSDTFVFLAKPQTLANKRVSARVLTITSSATPAVNTDSYDAVNITALAAAVSTFSTSLTGTPVAFDQLIYRIKDDGTPRALAWGASFVSRGATLPTTTVASKILYVQFIYNAVAAVWDCVSTSQEA